MGAGFKLEKPRNLKPLHTSCIILCPFYTSTHKNYKYVYIIVTITSFITEHVAYAPTTAHKYIVTLNKVLILINMSSSIKRVKNPNAQA